MPTSFKLLSLAEQRATKILYPAQPIIYNTQNNKILGRPAQCTKCSAKLKWEKLADRNKHVTTYHYSDYVEVLKGEVDKMRLEKKYFEKEVSEQINESSLNHQVVQSDLESSTLTAISDSTTTITQGSCVKLYFVQHIHTKYFFHFTQTRNT